MAEVAEWFKPVIDYAVWKELKQMLKNKKPGQVFKIIPFCNKVIDCINSSFDLLLDHSEENIALIRNYINKEDLITISVRVEKKIYAGYVNSKR